MVMVMVMIKIMIIVTFLCYIYYLTMFTQYTIIEFNFTSSENCVLCKLI